MHIAAKYRAAKTAPLSCLSTAPAATVPTKPSSRCNSPRADTRSPHSSSVPTMHIIPLKKQSQSQRKRAILAPTIPRVTLATLPIELLVAIAEIVISGIRNWEDVRALMESCRRLCVVVRDVIERAYLVNVPQERRVVSHGSKSRSGLKEKDVMRDGKVKGANMVHTERRHGRKSDIVKANRTVSWAEKFMVNERIMQLAGRCCWDCGTTQVHHFSDNQIYIRHHPRCKRCVSKNVRTHMACARCSRLRPLARFAKKQRKSDHPYCMKCWVELYGTENMTKSMPWMLGEDTDPVADD